MVRMYNKIKIDENSIADDKSAPSDADVGAFLFDRKRARGSCLGVCVSDPERSGFAKVPKNGFLDTKISNPKRTADSDFDLSQCLTWKKSS